MVDEQVHIALRDKQQGKVVLDRRPSGYIQDRGHIVDRMQVAPGDIDLEGSRVAPEGDMPA